jgi:2-oxoglutarate ferredoxin oxidoreductase subunit delta
MSSGESKGVVRMDHELCKGCGLCVSFCPEQVLYLALREGRLVAVAKEKGCIACRSCGIICPEVAVEVFRSKAKGKGKG